LGGLAIAIFELPTLICLLLSSYFAYRYTATILKKHSERGLIELLPERLQNQLLNRSIFDMLCDFWFYESFQFIKLLFRPLIEPV
jgi:hypothetical protein